MIYIFRPRHSDGAEELAYSLTGAGFPARFIRKEREIKPEDSLVCWGWQYPLALPRGVKVLNNAPPPSKLTEIQRLAVAGVPTVEVSRTRRANVAGVRPDYNIGAIGAEHLNEQSCRDLMARLQAHLSAPLPPAQEWLPRSSDHMNGDDLLDPANARADFWVKKENLAEEIRIHSFAGRSIRAGRKVQKRGAVNPHPWVRSTNAGWTINYAGFQSTPQQREVAHAAVAACGLQFGAVDIGIRPDGSLVVLEVNRAPGLEGSVEVDPYVKAIQGWMGGR